MAWLKAHDHPRNRDKAAKLEQLCLQNSRLRTSVYSVSGGYLAVRSGIDADGAFFSEIHETLFPTKEEAVTALTEKEAL